MPQPEKIAKTPSQQQTPPGDTDAMRPRPDHGEESYKGSGRLKDKVALITGGDSGIGKAIAIAFAREGAHVAIAYLEEHDDAKDTVDWIERAGRQSLSVAGDITDEKHCQRLIEETVRKFGKLDILVNNAAFQRSYEKIEDIPSEEWDQTFRTNIYAPFYLCKAAVPHLRDGATIINTTSIQSTNPTGKLLAYASTKGAISNFTAGLAELLADKNIRVNAVAPGPIWTPLIPSTLPPEKVEGFGSDTPLGRVGQPAELAPAYVFLASDDSTYVTGAVVPVTGGKPML